MLKAPPYLTTAPSTESTLQLKPSLRRGLITARPLASVCVAACHPVAAHDLSGRWVVETRQPLGGGGHSLGDLTLIFWGIALSGNCDPQGLFPHNRSEMVR